MDKLSMWHKQSPELAWRLAFRAEVLLENARWHCGANPQAIIYAEANSGDYLSSLGDRSGGRRHPPERKPETRNMIPEI